MVIWKAASAGYEDHPAVMLQGHLDMVCVAGPGVAHDFTRDPLELEVDGGWVRAKGTTLGGDDGIAVAMVMALLDDGAVPHPPWRRCSPWTRRLACWGPRPWTGRISGPGIC